MNSAKLLHELSKEFVETTPDFTTAAAIHFLHGAEAALRLIGAPEALTGVPLRMASIIVLMEKSFMHDMATNNPDDMNLFGKVDDIRAFDMNATPASTPN